MKNYNTHHGTILRKHKEKAGVRRVYQISIVVKNIYFSYVLGREMFLQVEIFPVFIDYP